MPPQSAIAVTTKRINGLDVKKLLLTGLGGGGDAKISDIIIIGLKFPRFPKIKLGQEIHWYILQLHP